MATSNHTGERENLLLRIIWMVVFFFVWQLAELVLLAVVVVQLVVRLFSGRVNEDLQRFGDSLSQYLAHIGRFATFNTEYKPWPFADWPVARAPEVERVAEPAAVVPPVTPPAAPDAGQPKDVQP